MTQLGNFRDDFYNPACVLTTAQFTASTQNGGTVTAAALASATENYIAFSGQTTAQALTTDTAANIIANLQTVLVSQLKTQLANGSAGSPPAGVPSLLNLTLQVSIINNNTSSGAITLSGGTGVTISGTNTIAITTSRQFLLTVTGPSTVTLTSIGTGGVN